MTTPASPDRTTPPAIPGLAFERPVGVGGTSVVWLARQTALDRPVAVKVLDPDRLADPAERARFNAEARAAVRLASPAIVQILDYGEAPDGRLYYVMEYVEGGSLADWLRDNPHMPPRAVWQVLRVVASTLDAAFSQASIIHADIKPGNILLAADGTIRLADLGLASLADARSAPPSDVVEGTPTYFAPEQLEGASASPQSDMYSLGLTAYHLLTGRPPFEGLPSPDAVLEAQRSDYLPDPIPLAPGLTTAGAWLLQKLTAKDPALRPASWADVVADLDRVAADLPPSPPYPDPADTTILLEASHAPTARDNARPRLANGRRVIRVPSAGAAASPGAARAASSPSSRPRPAAPRRSAGLPGFVKFLLFLLFFAAILGAIWFFAPADFRDALTGKKKPAPRPAPRPEAPAAPAEPAPEPPAEPAPAPDASLAPNGAWTNPDYVALANRFNDLLSRYRTAAGLAEDFTRPADAAPADFDDPVWAPIADDVAAVATGLDALLPLAPPDFPLRDYANQAWQLARDARLAMRSRAEKISDHRRAPKHRHPDLAPWPTPPVEDPSSPFARTHFQLGYAWDALPAPDTLLASEFLLLIAAEATSSPSTLFLQQKLVGPVSAPAPVADAAKALSIPLPLPARVALTNSVFPYAGVFRYDVDPGRWGNIRRPAPAYPRLALLADAEDRLVALYFYDPSPSALVHDPATFAPTTRTADFIEGTELPDPSTIRATHVVLTGPTLLRVDSESADFASDPPSPLRQSTLILPSPLANATLYHLFGRSEPASSDE